MGFLHCVGFLLVLIGAILWCVSGRLCYFGQEPDPDQRGSFRWVLPLEKRDLCACSEIRPGGMNMVIPKRAFQPYYTDHPIFTDNQEIIHDYFKCHGDCEAKMQAGYKSSGVYTIYPPQFPSGLRVYCKMGIKHGWIVFQRRFMNGTLNFNRTWAEYKEGFGILTDEFWLGNEILRVLTNGESKWEVRMDLEYEDKTTYSNKNFPFRVSGNNYTIHVGTQDQICVKHRIKNNALKITVSSNSSESSRWCPRSDDTNPWYRIDEREPFNVTGLHITGQEMELYQVEYSYDNVTWENITATRSRPNHQKNLKGNTTWVTTYFYLALANKTRYVRIKPEGNLMTIPDVRIVPKGCKVYNSYKTRIGLANGFLRNKDINASSSGYGQQNGWCPAFDDKNPWLQFDLGKKMELQGVIMKGGETGWVERYRVEYQCCDGVDDTWQNVTCSPHSNEIFNGTGKRSKKVTSNFNEPITARVIRIIPTAFNDTFTVMSVEFISTEGDVFDKADKAPFSTYDRDNDGDEENCAIESKIKQGWWHKDCRTKYVEKFDKIVKVEFKIRINP